MLVAIPFVKGKEYLALVLGDLLLQTDDAWRAAVVVGADTVDAYEVVEQVHDPRISVVGWNGESGIASTWNRCLELAGDDLLAIVHADDRLDSKYVSVIRRGAAADPSATVIVARSGDVDAFGDRQRSLISITKRTIEPRRSTLRSIHGPAAINRLMVGQWIVCPAVAYRRSLLGGERFDTKWHQVLDLEFFCRLLLAGHRFAAIGDEVYRYRRHRHSASVAHLASGRRFDEETLVHREIARSARHKGWRITWLLARLRVTSRVHAALFAFPIAGASAIRPPISAVAADRTEEHDEPPTANPLLAPAAATRRDPLRGADTHLQVPQTGAITKTRFVRQSQRDAEVLRSPATAGAPDVLAQPLGIGESRCPPA